MKVIVTGGSGFIGTNVIQHLESEGYDIRSLDIVMPKLKEHETYFKRVDVADRNALQDAIIEFNPDYIIHLAAQTGMESIDPNAFHTNIESAKNLCSISGNVSNLKRSYLPRLCSFAATAISQVQISTFVLRMATATAKPSVKSLPGKI